MSSLRLAWIALPLLLIGGVTEIYVMKISLGSQTIPTLVSGIASSTSIVVGFSGTLIGLMFRGIDRKHGLTHRLRLAIAFAVIGLMWSTGQLFIAFFNLAMSNCVEAVRSSLLGLLFSFCTFFSLAVIIVEKMVECTELSDNVSRESKSDENSTDS
jgi:hypothetical protein